MKRKLVSLFLSLSLMVVSVTGCQSDSVTEETKKEVQTKKSHGVSTLRLSFPYLQYDSNGTFRNVPLLLSHACPCAGWFDAYVLCYFPLKRGAGCASDGDQQPGTPVDSTLAARPLSNKWQLYGVEWNYW